MSETSLEKICSPDDLVSQLNRDGHKDIIRAYRLNFLTGTGPSGALLGFTSYEHNTSGRIAPVRPQIPLPPEFAGACGTRIAEYTAGRRAAQEVLKLTGKNYIPARNPDGTPVWPAGICGSISHDRGTAAVLICDCSAVQSAGIDICLGTSEKTAADIRPLIMDSSEMDLLNGFLSEPDATALLFSAKECLYKMIYPQVREFMDFREAVLTAAKGGRQYGTLGFRLDGQRSIRIRHKQPAVSYFRYRCGWLTVGYLDKSYC